MVTRTVRTTVAVPETLLEAVDRAVQGGKAKSRNELIANALRHELAAFERSEIDAAFHQMAEDQDFHEEARKVSKEFAESDWEAFHQSQQLR
jgi:metal-responsive CopG/Arc/MetJ family transcriptional regulator